MIGHALLVGLPPRIDCAMVGEASGRNRIITAPQHERLSFALRQLSTRRRRRRELTWRFPDVAGKRGIILR